MHPPLTVQLESGPRRLHRRLLQCETAKGGVHTESICAYGTCTMHLKPYNKGQTGQAAQVFMWKRYAAICRSDQPPPELHSTPSADIPMTLSKRRNVPRNGPRGVIQVWIQPRSPSRSIKSDGRCRHTHLAFDNVGVSGPQDSDAACASARPG